MIKHSLIRPVRLSYADALTLAREDKSVSIVDQGGRIVVTHNQTGRKAAMFRPADSRNWRCEVVGTDGQVHFCELSKGHTLTFAVRHVQGYSYHC